MMTLLIPDWLPCRLNQIIGKHWAVGKRLKENDRDMVAAYARTQRCALATGKRRVSFLFTCTNKGRLPDPDSMLKSALDSLVNAALLRDDSGTWCELGSVSVRRGNVKSTRIVLEEL